MSSTVRSCLRVTNCLSHLLIAAQFLASGATHAPHPDDFLVEVDHWVFCHALQIDGRILVGGRFSILGGETRSHIGRLNPDGTVDKTFDPGADNQVRGLAVQEDGKVLVGGWFTTLGGEARGYIGRLNEDGTLDADFDPIANADVECLVLQADGKILLGGGFSTLGGQSRSRIGRLNPNGTLDSAFNPRVGGEYASVNSIAVQGDGKILVAGFFDMLGGQPRNAIGRLNADGTLDTSFNPVLGGVGFPNVANLIVQGDGKILVGGEFAMMGGQTRNHFGRLNADGTLDGSFDPRADGWVGAIALQADGSILVGGSFATLGGQPRQRIGRLRSDGAVDRTFDPGADSEVYALTVQSDGKILVGGSFNLLGGQPRPHLGRLNNTQSASQVLSYEGNNLSWRQGETGPEIWRTTFEHSQDGLHWSLLGVGGRSPSGWRLSVTALPDGGTVRARGFVSSGNGGWFIENYYGKPVIPVEPGSQIWDAGSGVTISASAYGSEPLSLRWYKDGLLLVDGGNVRSATSATLRLIDVLAADEGDYWLIASNSFGQVTSRVAALTVVDPAITAGPASAVRNAGESVTFSVTAKGTPPLTYEWYLDGATLVGESNSSLVLHDLSGADAGRYSARVGNQHGQATSTPVQLSVNMVSLDSGFNPGIAAEYSSMRCVALQADGRVLVGGSFWTLGGQPRIAIGRLNTDGTLDASFNPGVAGDYASVGSMVVQGDRRIVVGGNFSMLGGEKRSYVGRLNEDGTLDAGFDTSANAEVACLALQADGRILLGGSFTTLGGQTRSRIGRLNQDGTLDSAFNPGVGGEYASVNSIAVQGDGKILVAGFFDMLGRQPRNAIGRLNADGTIDTSFNPVLGGVGFPNVANLVVQGDGKILVGGEFAMMGGETRKHFGRLNADGTLDGSFDPRANNWVGAIALQADGRILVGGNFTTLGGELCTRIGRLNPDGSLDSTFNPGVGGEEGSAFVSSLLVQPDGNTIVGGNFTMLGGQPRRQLGRLHNNDVATQAMTYDGGHLDWGRGGASPEVWRTTFEHSQDGLHWSLLGAGTRTSYGWRLSIAAIPSGGTVRARGYVSNGNGGWFIENFYGEPVILGQPVSQSYDAGSGVTFSASAYGSEPLSLRWYKDGLLLVDGGNVRSATSATLTLIDVLAADEGDYWLIASNSFGQVTSRVAALTVVDPAITAGPASAVRNAGESVTFSVAAKGTPPLTYEWYLDGATLVGESNSSLVLHDLSGTDAGRYSVKVSNDNGHVTNTPVPLSVNMVKLEGSLNPGANSQVHSLAVQADGGVLVGGNFTSLGGQSRSRIGRLDASGSVDGDFNPGALGPVYSVVLQDDSKILLGGGFTTLGGQPRNYLGRINANGILDTDFDPGANAWVSALVVLGDGRILAGGGFTILGGQPRARIGRLNPNGSLDSTFNPRASGGDDSPFVSSLAVQGDGMILVGGRFTTLAGHPRSNLGRLYPDGTLDGSFDPGADLPVASIVVQADGRILVGGSFTMLGGLSRQGIGRLGADGSPDPTFNPGASGVVSPVVESLVLQADGAILVGGTFTTLGGHSRSHLGRLHADGTLDPFFNPRPDRSVSALAIQADGKVLVGGLFSSLAGQTRERVARLHNPDAPTQALGNDGSTITWLRGGASPEVWRTTFEYSVEGVFWSGLGEGTRVPGGWELAGTTMPTDVTIRARGYPVGGYRNASGGVVESYTTNRPAADLRVVNWDTPLQASAGQYVPVAWTVSNHGRLTATNDWIERVYLSPDAAPMSANATLVGEFPATRSLAAQESLRRSHAILLPASLPTDTDYWWIVVLDATSVVVEESEANNTRFSDLAMRLVGLPAPNLQVASMLVSSDLMSGRPATLTWAVTNVGTWSTGVGPWQDAIFFSTNAPFDTTTAVQIGLVSRPHALAVDSGYSSSLTFTLPQGLDGIIHFFVETDTANRVNEGLGEGDNFKASGPILVRLSPPPDLRVTAVDAPIIATSGAAITVGWRVSNAGPGATVEADWVDDIYLAPSADPQNSVGLLGSVPRRGALANGESYEASSVVQVPDGLEGSFHLLVRTDARNEVFEHSAETNNLAESAPISVSLTPPPDLAVTKVFAPLAALSSHSVEVEYIVANLGPETLLGRFWEDRIHLSADPTLDGMDRQLASKWRWGGLGSGQRYTNTCIVTLPEDLSGPWYVLVETDAGGEVFELNVDNNVAASIPAMVMDSRPADLVVTGLEAPTVGQAGSTVPVSWSVSNLGTGETLVTRWKDRLVLSSDATLGGSDDVVLLTSEHLGSLAPGASYNVDVPAVLIPFTVGSGSWRMLAVTDLDREVHEGPHEDNNASEPQMISIIRTTADLRVSNVSVGSDVGGVAGAVQVQSEDPIRVTWRVENSGFRSPNIASWADGIYLASPSGQDTNMILIGARPNQVSPPPGGSYTNAMEVILPPEVMGEFHVRVVADFAAEVIEDNRSNNLLEAAESLRIALRPVPDLAVIAVESSSEVFSGQWLELSWSVTNRGPASAAGTWFDSVYLSSDANLEPELDAYLGYAERPRSLATGESYMQTIQLPIPPHIAGLLHVFVVCDSTGLVNERGATFNNVGLGPERLAVWIHPPADLIADVRSVPNSVVAGEKMELSYILRNQGTNPAVGPWVDALYLSADGVWDMEDVLLVRAGQDGLLAPGDSRTNTLNATVSGVVPGEYHVILRTDVLHQVPEVDKSNNVVASLARVAVDLEELRIGEVLEGTLRSRQNRYYRVRAKAGQWLVINLNCSAPLAATGLFVRFGAIPTPHDFDFRHSNVLTANQRVVVPNTAEGDYYILVHGDYIPATDGVGISINAGLSSFVALDSSFGVGGNGGNLTIRINGVDLDRDCTVALIEDAGVERAAVGYYHENSTRMYATLDLLGLSPRRYTIVIRKGEGRADILPDALEVVEAGPPAAVIPSVAAPQAMRRNIAYTFTVQWSNQSLNDAPAPLLTVGNTVPFGFRPGDDSLGIRHSFLGTNTKGGPPGILPPGQTEEITFHSFSGMMAATYTVFVDRVGKNDAEPMDWYRVRPNLPADDTVRPDFDEHWDGLIERIGVTWGDYLKMLARNATLLPSGMGDPRSPGDLERLEWQRALSSRTPSIFGKITAESGHIDVQNLEVLAVPHHGGNSIITRTLTDGTFLFHDLVVGSYELQARSTQGRMLAPVMANPGESQPSGGIVLHLRRASILTLEVVGESGVPVEGAWITVEHPSSPAEAAKTDGFGHARLAGLLASEYLLSVEADGFARFETKIQLAEPGTTTLSVIQLKRGAKVRGVVKLGYGGVATNALVLLESGSDEYWLSRALTTAQDGSFEVTGVTEGNYQLVVIAPVSGALTNQLQVESDAHLDLGEIVLPVRPPQPSMSSLHACVDYTDGNAVLRAKLDAMEDQIRRLKILGVMAARGEDYAFVVWQYLDNCYPNMPRRVFTDRDAIVEKLQLGSLGGVGFRNHAQAQSILKRELPREILKAFRENPSLQLDPQRLCVDGEQVFPLSSVLDTALRGYRVGIGSVGSPLLSPKDGYWTFAETLAGGLGAYGMPGGDAYPVYPDYREVLGNVVARPAGDGKAKLVLRDIEFFVQDAFDFIPGNLGGKILASAITRQLMVLESYNFAHDIEVVAHWKYPEEFAVGILDQEDLTCCEIPGSGADCDPCKGANPPDDCEEIERPDSFDPNDIVGPRGYGLGNWIPPHQVLHYTVRFENHAEKATAPAQVVRIVHPLHPNLDLRTFRLGAMGFGTHRIEPPPESSSWETRLDLMETFGVILQVSARLDLERAEVVWEFGSIDPATGEQPFDPFVGFLPPNLDGIIGQGFTTYTIRPKASLVSGDIIGADARIYFDYNEPIDTPHIFNTIDSGFPMSSVMPLATRLNRSLFSVQWAGADGYLESGIRGFDVYVSENEGPWRLWLSDTPYWESTYVGKLGNVYAFYSVAIDNVGHREAGVPHPQANITLVPNTPPVLETVLDQTVVELTTLTMQLIATDNDIPTNTLAFSLNAGPSGMSIDPISGLLTWTLTETQAPGSYQVRATVTDDGEPPLSDTIAFTLVALKVHIEPPAIELPAAWDGEKFSVKVSTVPGRVYSLQYKDRLEDPDWTRLDEFIGDGSVQALVDSHPASTTRFYRLRVD